MLRRVCCFLLLMSIAQSLSAQVYWKKDHIYNGPNGKEIAVVMPQPTDQTAPTAPSSLTLGTVTATSVQLSWTGSSDSGGSGLAGYKVYRQQGSGANLPVGTVGPGVTSFTDQPLTPSTSLNYTVVAYDNSENHSSASNTVSTTTAASSGDTTPPSVPSNVTGYGASGSTIQLNWNSSTDTGGSGMGSYRVYRNGSLVGSPTPNSFLDTGLSSNTSYSYTVAAVDNAGNISAASNAISVATTRTLVFKDSFSDPDGTTVSYCTFVYNGTIVRCWGFPGYWTESMFEATYSRSNGTGWSICLATPDLQNDFKETVQIVNNPGSAGLYFWDDYPWATAPEQVDYRAYVNGTTLTLSVFSSYTGAETVLTTATVPAGAATLSVEAFASSRVIKVTHNGILKISYAETDTNRPNRGRAGLTQYNTTGAASDVFFDNFKLEQ
jgi:chitodextrinase